MATKNKCTVLLLALSLGTASSVGAADAWEEISAEDGIRTFGKKTPGSGFVSFKGNGIVDVHIARLLAVFLDDSKAKDWTDMLVGHRVLSYISRNDQVVYQHYDLNWPVSDRDYVTMRRYQVDPDKRQFVSTYQSIRHPKMPPQECCIRAITMHTAWRFVAIPESKKTRVEVEALTDPRGALPVWMINFLQKDWPRNTILALVQRAQKSDVEAHPDYQAW